MRVITVFVTNMRRSKSCRDVQRSRSHGPIICGKSAAGHFPDCSFGWTGEEAGQPVTFLVDVVHDTAVELEVERNIAYERALTKLGCIMQVYVERTLPNVAQFFAQLIDEVGHLIRSWCEGRTPCLPQHKGRVYIHVHVKLIVM